MSAPMEKHELQNERRETAFKNNEEMVEQQQNLITEHGVTVVSSVGKTPTEKAKAYNARMKFLREIVLCVLQTETLPRKDIILCLDAVAGTGITGLQWKKRLRKAVHVTIAEKDTMEGVLNNCDINSISHPSFPLDFSRVPGDPMVDQEDDSVHVCKCAAMTLLHMESYDFVYLNPHGSLVNHIDAAMSNHRNNGLLCIVSTDSTHQFTRSGHTVRRHYDAVVTKTDYLKELAIRVMIATTVRSAAKCNKGVDVLLSVCVDDFFLVILRVLRGPKLADGCLDQINHVLHCQMCEERAFYTNTLAPVEHPYKLLSCSCKENTPGKTGVVLGPVWSGNLFNREFLDTTKQNAQQNGYSEKLQNLLMTVIEEAKCEQCQGQEDSEPPVKRQKISHNVKSTFYYNTHKHKLKGINLPKFNKLLEQLHQEGYRASRTHFDPNGLRTNATWAEVAAVLSRKNSAS